MTEQPDRPHSGDAVPTRIGGWRPPDRPVKPIEPEPEQEAPARRARHRAERPRRFGRRGGTPGGPARPTDQAPTDPAPADVSPADPSPADPSPVAQPRPEDPATATPAGGEVAERSSGFDTLAPGWSGLAELPPDSRRPQPPSGEEAESSAARPAGHRSARSWLAEDDFADTQPAVEPRDPRTPRGARVRPEQHTRPSEPTSSDAPDDADLPDETRLTAEELPWGVPARAAAGDGPLPPAELVPRGHNPLRVALVVLGCCVGAAALVLLILLVLTRG